MCGVYVTTAHWTSERHCKALRRFTGPLSEPAPLPSLPAHWAKPPGSPHHFEYREDFEGYDGWWCLLCSQFCTDAHVDSKQHHRKLRWEANLVPAGQPHRSQSSRASSQMMEQQENRNDATTIDSSQVVSRDQRLIDAQDSEWGQWAPQSAPPPSPQPEPLAEPEAFCEAENAQHLFALAWQPTESMQWLDDGAVEKEKSANDKDIVHAA